ncbi:MAG: hypothetical protein IPN01_03390 [Deltaproteobacteria bacterium]|nr:hypothetical protein [Deltaproteobacteria bacterium]
MSPLPFFAVWMISVAQAQDTLTARIVPSHPRPGERVYLELEYSHGGPDAVRVPTRALDAVVVTGELLIQRGKPEVIVGMASPSAPIPAADVVWTSLNPGEPLRRALPLGDVLSRCAPGCPAGTYDLSLSLTPLVVTGAALDQHLPAPPPVNLQFEVIAEALGVEATGTLTAKLKRVKVSPEGVTARVVMKNVSTLPLRVPREDGAVLPSCSLWWRDEAGEEAGSLSTVGVGGQRTLDESSTVSLEPGASIAYDVSCSAGAPDGVTIDELRVTLRPIAPFAPTVGPDGGVALFWTGSLVVARP